MKRNILLFILCAGINPLCAAQPVELNQEQKDAIHKSIMLAFKSDDPKALKVIAKTMPSFLPENANSLLLTAVTNNSINVLTYLLDQPKNKKPNINLQDLMGNTPLIHAACAGNENIIKILIDAGAKLNEMNRQGLTAFSCAAMNNKENAAKLLFEAGADITKGSVQKSQIHKVKQIVDKLTQKEKKIKKLTELIDYLYSKERLDSIKKLIAQSPTITKEELLLEAVSIKKNNAVQYLLDLPEKERPDVDYAEKIRGFTPLLAALTVKNTPAATLLIEAGADLNKTSTEGYSPLMFAALTENNPLVKKLLDSSVDINAVDNLGYSALTRAVKGNNKDGVRLLLDKGANIATSHDDNKASLIYISIRNHNTEILKMLLDKQANLANVKIKIGNVIATPLMLASEIGSPEIIRLLIENKANPNEVVDDSPTPLFIAATANKPQIVEELLKAGATPLKKEEQKGLKKEEKKQYQAIRKKLKKKKRRVQAPSIQSCPMPHRRSQTEPKPSQSTPPSPATLSLTPQQLAEQEKTARTMQLWEMVNQGQAKQLRIFLRQKPLLNMQYQTKLGANILFNAVKQIKNDGADRRYQTLEFLLQDQTINNLINDPDKYGKTVLDKAYENNDPRLIGILEKYGSQRSSQEATPLAPSPPYQSYNPDIDKDDQPSLEATQKTLKTKPSDDPLFAELSRGNRTKTETLKEIIRQDHGSLTRQRKAGKTPLMHAIESKVKEKELRYILKELTPEHINLEEQTEQRDTALTKAIRNGIWPWINLLLSHGALIRKEDIKTAQQLHDDEQRSHGNTEKAKKLWKNLTLLQQAKEHQNANKMLLKATQEPTENFEPIERVLEMGADINTKDEHGNTPLMYSIMTKNNVTAKGLIERNAQLNLQNKNGKTALILAVDTNNYDLADYLLQHGADETMSDTADATAYGYATANGYTDIANRILTYRALKALKKSGTIKHVLNRHTILGKNKKPTMIGTGQVIQNQPYIAQHKDKSTASFFPRSWSKEKIQKAIIHVLQKPEQLHEQPAQITEDNQVLRNALILRGSYEGIPIKVIISQTNDKHEPWKVFTAYPIIK